ncbi:PREDICTED: NF-kappa-B inhibitor epsilon [Thamnophis sirtalis]|uniref:NF-kappa-B inhibitor epsilon n=1 Tax=Thamnophis sirtalis TaxID=35019 RepID=A0A6I9X2U5_9SAUR|nr:PREDICTED: NF-kappa-B inhibitor epsilon [Thamnophis sirtalis]
MSEIQSYGEKKEMLLEGGGGAYLEEGQCDSGIDFIRSLSGQPGEAEPRSPATAGRIPLDKIPGTPSPGKEEPADERLDSSYGSSSIVESLTGLQGEPNLEKEEEEEQEERLRQQLLKTLDFLSEDGDTLLHLAIIHCVPSIASFCIAQMPVEVLEFQNDLFQTPLHLSVYLEQFEVVEALILKGVNTALQDRNGNTALHLACERQSLECVELLLLLKKPVSEMQTRKTVQDLQLQNWQGLTCLHISTLKGNLQLMELLVQNGANINVQDGTSGKTPLHLAVENHDEMAVKHLLRWGAQVDSQMYNGCTPLHLAVGRNDAAIAAILCHSGADTLLRNMENETAQDLADGNDDILTLLPFDDLKISGKPVMCSSRTS